MLFTFSKCAHFVKMGRYFCSFYDDLVLDMYVYVCTWPQELCKKLLPFICMCMCVHVRAPGTLQKAFMDCYLILTTLEKVGYLILYMGN